MVKILMTRVTRMIYICIMPINIVPEGQVVKKIPNRKGYGK